MAHPAGRKSARPATAAPVFHEVRVVATPAAGVEQHPHSIQVGTDVALKLRWKALHAVSVQIEGVGGKHAAAGVISIPTVDATYRLFAVSAHGRAPARSK